VCTMPGLTSHTRTGWPHSSRRRASTTALSPDLAAQYPATEEFSLVRFHGDQAKADKVYQGVDSPLVAADIAECVRWPARGGPAAELTGRGALLNQDSRATLYWAAWARGRTII
jgi:hypothetical protein